MIGSLEKNREYSERYTQHAKNPKVPKEICDLIEKEKIHSLIDLGCGDGIFIHAVKKEFPKIEITGIDISPRRINRLKKKFPEDNFYIKDVCNTKLKERFDLVYSSQVIEHVQSDKEMIKEMSKLLKEKGFLFCSSVIKKHWAIYKYRNNRKFVLDPTHEREYANKQEFLGLFRERFKLISCTTSRTVRKKFGIRLRIPGFYEVYGVWRKR